MPVITVTGAFGSGGLEIGQMAAQILAIDYVDRQLLVDTARHLGVPVASVARRDERTMSLGERLATVLRTFLERSAIAGAGDPLLGESGLEILLSRTYSQMAEDRAEEQTVDEARYVQAVTTIIKGLAEHGNVLLMGRGSQVILRGHPTALHVFGVAPLEQRIQRVAQREGISREEAAKRVHTVDKGRLAFHRKLFKVDANDPLLYDLVLNTGRTGLEIAAEAVAAAARWKEERLVAR